MTCHSTIAGLAREWNRIVDVPHDEFVRFNRAYRRAWASCTEAQRWAGTQAETLARRRCDDDIRALRAIVGAAQAREGTQDESPSALRGGAS